MLVRRRKKQAGQAMVETALMAPWIFFLFVGILDVGFYCYSYICTQNAARAAAIQTAADQYSQTDTIACRAALTELNFLANASGVTSCGGVVSFTRAVRCGNAVTSVSSCTFGTATNPTAADADGTKTSTPDQKAASSYVTITYQSIPLVPIPGILPGKLNITRTAEMRIIAE